MERQIDEKVFEKAERNSRFIFSVPTNFVVPLKFTFQILFWRESSGNSGASASGFSSLASMEIPVMKTGMIVDNPQTAQPQVIQAVGYWELKAKLIKLVWIQVRQEALHQKHP